MNLPVILLGIIAILLMMNIKEGFSTNDKIANFLNTWSMTNQELEDRFELTNNVIRVKHPLSADRIDTGHIRTQDQPITFKHQKNTDNNVSQMFTKKLGLVLGADGKWVTVNSYHSHPGLTVRNKNHGDTHLGWTDGKNYLRGAETRIENGLCINNTCINENHLKILKGEKIFSIADSNVKNWTLRTKDGNAIFRSDPGNGHNGFLLGMWE